MASFSHGGTVPRSINGRPAQSKVLVLLSGPMTSKRGLVEKTFPWAPSSDGPDCTESFAAALVPLATLLAATISEHDVEIEDGRFLVCRNDAAPGSHFTPLEKLERPDQNPDTLCVVLLPKTDAEGDTMGGGAGGGASIVSVGDDASGDSPSAGGLEVFGHSPSDESERSGGDAGEMKWQRCDGLPFSFLSAEGCQYLQQDLTAAFERDAGCSVLLVCERRNNSCGFPLQTAGWISEGPKKGETPEEAAMRGLKEELGLNVDFQVASTGTGGAAVRSATETTRGGAMRSAAETTRGEAEERSVSCSAASNDVAADELVDGSVCVWASVHVDKSEHMLKQARKSLTKTPCFVVTLRLGEGRGGDKEAEGSAKLQEPSRQNVIFAGQERNARAARGAIEASSGVKSKAKSKLRKQDWGRAGAAGNRFARDKKEPGPQLGTKP